MKKGALEKGNKKKLSRIDKIEKALYELIEEGKITSKRIREISEENEKGFKELRESINKTSERVDKVYELFDKTSERLDRAYELSERAFAAADRAFAAADRAFAAAERASQEVARASEEVAKTSEEIKKLKTEISRLTGSWGEFVEGMIEPSAIKFMEQKGFKVIGVYPEAKVSRDGENAEYDLFLVCEKKSNNSNRKKDKVILLVSAKTKVSSRDVDELLEDMKKFFFFLEQYKGFKLMGAIAGIRFGKGADIYALRSGLIVMKPAGEVMQIQEPKKVRFVS
jgi:DNA-binding PadR family transcriptional regulator